MKLEPICGVCGKRPVFAVIDVVNFTPHKFWCARGTGWYICTASLAAEHALNPDRPGLEDDVAAGGEKE